MSGQEILRNMKNQSNTAKACEFNYISYCITNSCNRWELG